jgi:hypothetical protein
MEYETTNISDLPMNPQTSVNNLPAISTQMPKNEVVNAPNYNEVMSQCMNEVNQHEKNPIMELPQRDIPQNQTTISNDPETRNDYVPKKEADKIGEVKRVRFQEPPKEIEDELIVAVLASVLFLTCQLPFFKSSFVKLLTKIAPTLIKSDGNIKLLGNVLFTIIFGATLYGTIKTIDYSSIKMAF